MRDSQDVLTDLDSGGVHNELSVEINRLVAAVRETRKAGTLTLQLNVKLSERDLVVVRAEVKSKIPRPATEATSFFVDDEGGLSIHNPRQLKLKDVEQPVAAKKPLRDPVPARGDK